MENKKIDILNDISQIVSENFETGDRIFYDISSLNNEQLASYNSFMDLVKLKTSEPWIHIYVGDYPIKRFVKLSSESQEVYYDDLTIEEKSTFDVFFTTFAK